MLEEHNVDNEDLIQVWVVNVFTDEVFKTDIMQLKHFNIINVLQPHFSGLSLSDRMLCKIMKKQMGEFLKQRELHYQ